MALSAEEKKRLLAIAQRAGGSYAAQNSRPEEPKGNGRNGWLDFGLTTAGGAGGVAGGTAAGAAIGSIIPGVGTVIGGGIGALLGGALGGAGGQVASNAIQKRALDEGVAREALFGSLGGAGKAFKAGKLAYTAGKAADAGGDLVKIAKAADAAAGVSKAAKAGNILAKGGARSADALQSSIEKAINAGDFTKAQKLVNGIDDVALKQGMQSALDASTGAKTMKAVVDPITKKITMQPVAGAAKQATKKGVIAGARDSASKVPARMFAKSFSVPTKLAGRLKPVDTADEILKHGFGASSLDDLGRISGSVTGQNGILTKTTRKAISRIPKEVKTDNVLTSVRNMLDDIPDLTDKESMKILNTVIKSGKPGKLPGTMNALDAFDNVKHLEDIAYQYINSSTYLTKNLKHEQIGKALLAGADELKFQLDDAVKGFGILDDLKTPELMKQLSDISPRLAKQVTDAGTIADLRKIQAPFVRLGQMVNLTNDAAQSVGGSFAGGLGGRAAGGAAGFALGGPLGALGGVFASPMLEGVEQATRAPIATGGASILSKLLGRADDAAGVVSKVAANPSIGQAFMKNLPVQAALQGVDAVTQPPQPAGASELDNSILSNINMGSFDSSGNPTASMAGGEGGAVMAGKFTPELFQQYLLRDLAETGGKNFGLLEQLYGYFNPTGGAEDLSSTQQQSLTKLGTADTILSQIEQQLSTVGLGGGPLGKAQGTFKSVMGRLGLNDNAAAYEDFRKGIATQLAKALGESGNLSDQDIKRAIQMIPGLNDTAGQAQLKLQQLRQVIEDSRQNVYSLGGGASSAGGLDMGILTALMGAQ